ncbi:MAG: sensor histidine kinase KdpD [Bryobacteraceae bacterium]|nr:sensor histidine kinase KdpD [Bryobacteraceae bacterium]
MMRPDPEELLRRAEAEDRQQTRGKFKVFFGSSPGVGKTYAMLEAAHRQREAGRDVVVGLVETHQRAETGALLAGLELLPRRPVTHRGITTEEFDLDGALARHPDLLLVDELAHTNAPGCRHVKRWQDVRELVEAGINVYTTLNVQHLDSVNDIVAQVTGVIVRETLPDAVLDEADEVELVDLPAGELLARLAAGQVYVPEQAKRARESFFREGNLNALRELALRRTADRVDAQMRNYRRDHAIDATWPVTERILVCIGPSPFAAKLVRAAKRLADRWQAEWIVAFVETPGYATLSEERRTSLLSALRLAEQLGGRTVTLTGTRVADALLQYARSKNVSKIVIGKQAGPLWRRLWRGSVLDDLIELSGEVEIYAISGDLGAPEPALAVVGPRPPWPQWAGAATAVALCTLVSLLLRPALAPTNLAMIYLLGVTVVAMRCARRVSFMAAFLSVAAFDFFCIPPYLNFSVNDYEYLLTFAVMLTVGLCISGLTARVRQQAEHAVERESQTQALYQFTRELGGETRRFEVARLAGRIIGDIFSAPVVIFLPDEAGRISLKRRTTEQLPLPASEEGIAQWVFDHGERAGQGEDTLPGASATYLPLGTAPRVHGVLAILGEAVRLPERRHLLEVFAGQTALALERATSGAAAAEVARRMEAEQMRNSLLAAVSHDLRTPLASITGAATSLLAHGEGFDEGTRRGLLEDIAEEAARLGRLVNNLLEMSRLESGAEVKRGWHPLEEIVGAALTHLDHRLAGRAVKVDLPPDLPLVSVDDVLLEQVLINLFENAVKYTPAGSPVDLVAGREGDAVSLEILDRGPGWPPGEERRVFDKFFRGPAGNQPGAGLGLAICRAVIAAHGGAIEARNREGGGAVVKVTLPIGGVPPESPSLA